MTTYSRTKKNQLTPAEEKVFALLVLGLRNKEIADRLGVTVDTVKFHLFNLYKKKGFETRAEAIASKVNLCERCGETITGV